MKKIWTYLIITFSLSAVFYILIISLDSIDDAGLLIAGLMWVPGIAAIATSLFYYRSLKGLGFKIGKGKYIILSLLLPLIYSFIPYSAVWGLKLGEFVPSNFQQSILPFITIELIIGCLFALGEEIGWRGFLVPELSRHMNFTKVSLLSGFIWSAWHSPLIIFSGYNSGAGTIYSIIMFFVLAIGISFAFAWLRIKSGSLWTAVLIHGVHNSFIQDYLDVVTEDTGITKFITGEFGAALALSAIIVAFIFWKKRKRLPIL